MTPEEREMLIETRALVEENTKILRGLQRSSRINTIFKVIYWVLIIAISFGAYYLIQPYVNMLKGTINDIQGVSSSADSASFSFQDALKNIQEVTKLYGN